MKLYLSSYRFGDSPERLAALFGAGRRVGVIRNALDLSNDTERLAAGREREFTGLQALGLEPEEINLREYFGDDAARLEAELARVNGVWVVGGNSFVLRRAMRQSGFERLLVTRAADPSFVYAGYSAGICVLSPTLRGIDLVDPPDLVPVGYEPEVIWEGLGLVPFSFAPHFRSDHPESRLIERAVEYFQRHRLPFRALRDGEVYVKA